MEGAFRYRDVCDVNQLEFNLRVCWLDTVWQSGKFLFVLAWPGGDVFIVLVFVGELGGCVCFFWRLGACWCAFVGPL